MAKRNERKARVCRGKESEESERMREMENAERTNCVGLGEGIIEVDLHVVSELLRDQLCRWNDESGGLRFHM